VLATVASANGGARSCAPMLLIAHRGIAPVQAENTLAAFENAHRQGYEIVETDVRVSADDRFVLAHDQDLRRTSGRPERVGRLASDDLRRIGTNGGHPIPGVRRALRWAEGTGVRMVLNLKYAPERPWTVRRLARLQRLVERTSMADRVTYLAYSPRVLRILEALDESTRTAWVPARRPSVDLAQRTADQVYVGATNIDPDYVRAMHRAGVQVNGSTTQEPAELAALARAGVVRAMTDQIPPAVARDMSRMSRPCPNRPAPGL
jgi:glycerophosphoryl diester phosphodiesterase